jgi:ribosomal-protein-alanine N-acetyltransferase
VTTRPPPSGEPPRAVTLPALWGTLIGEAVVVDGSSFELRGSLVSVRGFVPEDENAFVEWAGHPEMYEHMTWRLDSSEAAAAYFRGLYDHPERTAPDRRRWFLAVVDMADAFCGMTGFDVRDDGHGEFGWYLAPRVWGKGYATQITTLLLEFGFEQLGLPAIEATCDPANVASRRVLEKSGLSVAGDETADTWHGERPRVRYVIAADSWRRSRQQPTRR